MGGDQDTLLDLADGGSEAPRTSRTLQTESDAKNGFRMNGNDFRASASSEMSL
jgi:hypothetical protein